MTRRQQSLGLIGAGRWGRNYIHTIERLVDVDLAWIADPNPAVADAFASLCPVYKDWRVALATGGAAGVIVATPPCTHADIAEEAIAAGLGVLIEKPLTTSPAQAKNLLAAAERGAGPIWVDHVHLFSPGYQRLRELIEAERPIRRIVSHGGNWGPFRSDTPVLWDWGPHDIAFCLDLAGSVPERVHAAPRERRKMPEGVGEILDIRLDFSGGMQATVAIGNIFSEKQRHLTVTCDRTIVVLDDTTENRLTQLWMHSDDTSPMAIPSGDDPPLTCAVRAFAEAIRTGNRDPASLRLGVAVVDVLASCERTLSA